MMKFLSLLLLSASLFAQEEVSHPRDLKLPTLAPYSPPSPIRFESETGPTLLVLPDTRLPLIDGVAMLRIGSADDPEAKTGLVELLVESLRRGGSESLPGQELDSWLDAHGARLEFRVEPEYVRIEFSCLSEHTRELLTTASELLRKPLLPEDSIEKARKRIASAFERERDDTGALADRMLLRAAYGADSAYSRSGRVEELESITRSELLEFHSAHFGADRMVLGVAGNVDPELLNTLIQNSFGEWKASAEPKPHPAPAFLQPRSRVIHVIDRPGVTQTELRLAAPGIRRLHPDYAALSLWSHAIGAGGAANRMMVKVRTELGLAYTVGAYYRGGWKTAGRFEGWCGVRNESVAEALAAMLKVLEGGKLEFAPNELKAVRARLLNGRVFEVDTPGEVLERGVLLEFYSYPKEFRQQVEERLRALTSSELSAAVNRHLDLERLIVIAVGPAKLLAEQLSEFGELVMLDDRGELIVEPATALADELFASMGGRERWKNLETLHRTGTLELETGNGPLAIPKESWQALPSAQSRTEVIVNGTKSTIVMTSDSCFSLSANSIEDLPADRCETLRTKAAGNIYPLLRHLARGNVSARVEEDSRRLIIEFESGLKCNLHVAKDGRPGSLRISYQESEEFWEYLEWTETDGFPWFTEARERNLSSKVMATSVEFNPQLSADLFQDPRKN